MSLNIDRNWTIVLSHGWAMQDWFWKPLRTSMGDHCYSLMALPFFEEHEEAFRIPVGPWIGIGHSRGFQRLTQLDLAGCEALISVSGFWNFCGERGTSKRIVQRMIRRFEQSPREVLETFYQNCGLNSEPPQDFDRQVLQQELEQLLQSSEFGATKKVDCRGVPVFAITGAQDKIVPCELAKQEFANLAIHPEAGHSLGFDEPQWCAEQIGHFLCSI